MNFFLLDLQANRKGQDLVHLQNITGPYQNPKNEAGHGTGHRHGRGGDRRPGHDVDPDLEDDQHPELDIQDIIHLGIEIGDLGKNFLLFGLEIILYY